MKAQDLRVGNLIFISGKTVKVKAIDETGVNYYRYVLLGGEGDIILHEGCFEPVSMIPGEGLAEPMPLTPEILEKCGFEYHMAEEFGREYWWHDKLGSLSPCNKGGFDLDDTESGSVNKHPVLHLHQLQNLYWGLCGEELAVEL